MPDDLKNLSTEERIKRLKEIERKKKEEIAEAQKMLKESETELSEQEEWTRKVPIPQVAAERTEGLSAEEKELLAVHKGVKKKEEAGEEEKKPVKKDESLEETVLREKRDVPVELLESEYTARLSQQPMANLYQEIKEINTRVGDKGYVTAEESRKIEYLSAATERKLEDIETGKYSLTEQVAEAALLTRSIGENLRSMYKSKPNDSYQR
ncbi:MAG: hypothetical protein ABIA37_03680 [Candidatus Woesearchaeota archaeon]